ncbi:hypothetical protein SNOG_05765 [Parastagonospora nodorum SN15]|uniref:NAD-dependent epimerase/dehydratase domain-containing protein n=1 Tax=Phaeosphaeria nodorum (strain SN15 / ATCC MYA-4574 / FGSC 10173) TaxID=321614 RepID=Q0UR49_PHANO|nr:hypothetical protein SNOG_05765 [Parastagonospora nodorum SN15]EAT86829.1 hypothetical protein SNOG_05765 [Parastagonospora nodorum SN15]
MPLKRHRYTYENTGGTGHIGGSVLHTIYTAHPEWSITVLLRRVPETFTKCYPNVAIIQGDFDSSSLLSTNAEAADIVIHCGDSDHENSLNALLSGLLNPSHTRLPPASQRYINIAIMCPPDIYGRSKSLAKVQSALIPMFVKHLRTANNGRAFYFKDGSNTRSWVHIDDLMRLYLRVVEAAASPMRYPAEEYFNRNGYYFAATQEYSQIELATATADVLYRNGIVRDLELEQIGLDKLDSMANLPGFPKLARYLFASNSRTRPERAEKTFGYKGEAPGLMEVLEQDVLDAVGAT